MRPEGEWFKPEELTDLYHAYLVIGCVVALPAAAFVAMVATVTTGIVIGVIVVAALTFLLWWISAFYDTAAYRLTLEDIEYRRGVFFRKKSNVPYNRITNIETHQGPVQRYVGAGSVAIQTAGQSGQGATAELTVNGVADYEDIAEQVQEKVHGKPPEAVEAGEHDTGQETVVAELRKIRELLEQD